MSIKDSVVSSQAEVLTHNGLSPLSSEVRISRQVVVVQEPTLVLKLKAHQVHRLLEVLQDRGQYTSKGDAKDILDQLIKTMDDFTQSPYLEGDIAEPKTIFEE